MLVIVSGNLNAPDQRLKCYPVARKQLILRGVAQPGRAPGSGPGGRWFESTRPDQYLQPLHVLADAATSVVAIAALISARYFHSPWLDPVMGFAGSVMIILVVRVDQEIFFRASRS
jgi:hypothetical protein